VEHLLFWKIQFVMEEKEMCYQPKNCKSMESVLKENNQVTSRANVFSKDFFFRRDLRNEFDEFDELPFGDKKIREFIRNKEDNSLIKRYNSLVDDHFKKTFGSYLAHAGAYLKEF